MPKSNTNNNFLSRLGSFLGRNLARKRSKTSAKRLRLEQLESRRVFAALLLDFPGINGDTTVAGATATDMELTSFQWGFSRSVAGERSSLNDPIKFSDLTFKRTTDTASNDLYAQTALQTSSANPARLRLVDNGVNLLRFNLNDSRLTKFATTQGQTESGALSFSNVAFTENVLATPQNAGTPRNATWNLLNGAVTSSAIVGQSNIDIDPSSLSIETVMQIGNEKMRIDGFSWKADLDVDMSLSSPLSGLAKGTNFQIARGVDSATAGLLGSAAGGTIFPEIRISDRSLVAGKNLVTMEWRLYDAFFAGFDLEASAITGAPKNSLELSYGRIQLIVNQYSSSGVLAGTETTTWNEAGNIVSATNDFGIANPLLVDNTSNPVISSLNFGAPVDSPSGTPNLGRLEYESIDWSVSKDFTLRKEGNALGPTRLGAMRATLPAGKNAPAPALLGQLAGRSQLNAVNGFEKNTLTPTTALDTFSLTNVFVTGFNVKNEGLDETEINFDMDFRSFTETFTDRTTPATPLVTRAGFNVQTQSSTITPNFGGKTFAENDTSVLFVLAITEAGVTSEIPVQSANWSVKRSASINGDDVESSDPAQSTFDIAVPRGVHSSGLLAAAVRGTEIDSVSVRRFEVVDVSGTPTKKELYRWDLAGLFITEVGMHMSPGNSSDELDTISFLPSIVALATPNPVVGSYVTVFNFLTEVGSGGDDSVNEPIAQNPALRYKLGDVASGIAIDSYQWGATLPVTDATSSGTRSLGNPSPNNLLLSAIRIPSPKLLFAALTGVDVTTHAIKLPADGVALQQGFELKVNGLLDGFSYSDAIDAISPLTNISIFIGGGTNTAELKVEPINSNGTAGTPREVIWNLLNDSTANFSGFGNFQFATSALPATTLEIVGGGQLAADSYNFGIDNTLNQLVGTSTAATPLAARGNPTAKTFNVTTSMDRATPGLLNAIATRSLIPEIKITERRLAPNGNFLPWREWTLTNVYVQALANSGTDDDPQGDVTLLLNAASATSRTITFDAASAPRPTDRRLNFADVPAIAPIAVTAISTEADRVISFVSRFTDPQINYSTTVVTGANLFDGVSRNSQNQLVLNFKPGQRGIGQVRIDGINAFGLTSSLLVNVTMEDGALDAPAGTDTTVSFNEDSVYVIRTAYFGFTDPNDLPAQTMAGIRIASLPTLGSLRLNNVPVTLNQTIPVANLNANQLRYTPVANGQGTNYASFTFQVQDSGVVANLDLSPNRLTFNVNNTNDAPTFLKRNFIMPAVQERSTNHIGALVAEIVTVIRDIDPGALSGIAVVAAPTTSGTWQYALDGITWQSLAASSTSAARLLAADATTRVRFLPNVNFIGTSALTFHAWDRVTGEAGGTGSLTGLAPFRTFSTLSASLNVTVVNINDAPVLTPQSITLPQIDEDPVFVPGPTSGVPIAALVGGVTDPDTNAQRGIAVVEVSNTGGRWQYSLTNGETWNFFNTVSLSSARLLQNSGSNRVRFLPNANSTAQGTIRFHAWDITQGSNGGVFNLSGANATGGTTAFSTAFATATQTIRAINDAPTISVPASQSVASNTPLVFSTANGNRIAIGDVDASIQPVQMTITATNGTFTLLSNVPVTFVSGGNGQSSFTVSGPVSLINEALAEAFYTPNVGFFGNSSLTILVNDQGNSGVGGPLTATTTLALSVALPSNAVALGGLNAATPTIRRSGNRDGSTSTPDLYTFTIDATSDVRVNLSGLSGDLDLRVFNAEGLQVGQSLFFATTIENILMTALPAGTYLVDVRRSIASAYDLTISTNTNSDDLITQASLLPSPNATTLPTVRLPVVSSPADLQDYFRFELTTASALRINLSNLLQDVDFELLDSDGRVIQSASSIDNTIVNMLTSSLSAGTYYLRVFAFASPLTSDYDLTISTNTSSDDLLTNATSLGILGLRGSDRRTGNVAVGTDPQDYYGFAGGGDVAISLSGLTSDVDLQVLDRFGRVLAQSTGGGNSAESINLNIPAGSGSIFIRVFAFAGSSNYVLEARNNANAENVDDLLSTATALPVPLTSLTRTGSVGGTADPQDYYRFQLDSARNLAITLSGLSADLDIEVLDQFGNLLFFSRNGGSASESINIGNLGIGVYFIRIHPFGAAVSSYTLSMAVSNA